MRLLLPHKTPSDSPPKEEVTVFVPLSPMQRFWYKRLITRMDEEVYNEIFGILSNTTINVPELDSGSSSVEQPSSPATSECSSLSVPEPPLAIDEIRNKVDANAAKSSFTLTPLKKARGRGRPKLIDRLLREAKTTLRNTLIKETECEWKELQNQGYGALNKDGGSQWQKLMGLGTFI